MTGASDDARPSDEERAKVDAGWDALVEEAESGRRGETDPREASQSGGASESSAGHRISGSYPIAGKDRLSEPEQEMDRLMHGAPPTLPRVSDEGDAAEAKETASTNKTFAPPGSRPRKGETARAALAKKAEAARVEAAKKAAAAKKTEPDVRAESNRPALQVLRGGGPGESVRTEPPRAARPIEPMPSATPASGSTPWAWIGVGAIAVAAVAYFALGGDDGPASSKKAPVVAVGTEAEPSDAPSPLRPAPTPQPEDATEDELEGGSSTGTEPATPSTPRSSNPRKPPRGTPPEIAEVFERLPVSPSDRPPVGGIGATGIHVDRITMGSSVDDGICKGPRDEFSVERGESATVCVRVVHQREKEELQVLWEKHEGSTRRSKMVVQPRHAYRTRGHLKLRKEYIGDWTVKILSSDDVELARHEFTVVE